jgi:peptidoglycan/LPS O-acetylase OafA/YrhL
MTSVPTQPRLPALTSLRFFAALHVLIFHLSAIKIWKFTGVASRLQMTGYVGVSLFFVLSGFILVYVHGNREMRAGVFYRERIARIYPAYLFSLLLTAPGFFYLCTKLKYLDIPIYNWAKMHLGITAVLVPTLTQAWVPLAGLAWNPPAWSLSVEAFFYVLLPFALPWLLRKRNRNLVILIAVCYVIGLTLSSAYCILRPDGMAHVTDDANGLTWLNVLKFNPAVRFPEFIMGACCGVLYLRGAFSRRLATPLTAAGLLLFASVILLSPHIPYPILHNGLLAPAFAALIVGLALRPAWMSWMEIRPLVLLGNASYSLYLLHSFVLGVYFMPVGILKDRGPLWNAVGYVLPIVVAILVYRFVEEPARRKLRPKVEPRAIALAQPA